MRSLSVRSSLMIAVAVGSSGLWVVSSVHAAAIAWSNAAGGTFNVGDNWTDGSAPVAGQTAEFGLPNTYTVGFSNDPTNDAFDVSAGTVTFDLNSHTYTLTISPTMDISNATLKLRGGTVTGIRGRIAVDVDSTGTVDVSGSGAVWHATKGFFIGNSGSGTLNISDHGRVTNDNGTAVILGYGNDASGTVDITGGGTLESLASINIGNGGGSTGTVTISGADSALTSLTNIYVGDSAGTAIGLLTIKDHGAVATSSSSSRYLGVYGKGTINLQGDSSISTYNLDVQGGVVNVSGDNNQINGKATFNSAGTLRFTLNSPSDFGFLNVTGDVNLAGMVDIVLGNGYQPVSGASFDLLDAGSLTDNAILNLPTLGHGLRWDSTQFSTTGVISVVPEPASLGAVMVGGILLLRWRRKMDN